MDPAIANLLNQLNAVSSRLESVEKQLASGGGSHSTSSASTSSGNASDGGSSPSVQAYEALINQYIPNFVNLSKQLNAPEVAEQAELVQQAVNAQLQMLRVVASSKKPSQDVLQKLIQPTSELMGKIAQLRDSKRSSKFFNNLSTVSEGIPALGWVVVSPTPAPHVGEMRGASEFYSNRILKDFKGKDQTQVDWVSAFNGFLKDLQPFVKQYHTTGLEWNPRGGDASSASTSAPSQSSGGPPPPPGPPPPALVFEQDTNAPKKPDTSGLFAELSKGTDVSKGLKKVTSDMKTKNFKDKSSVVPATATAPKSTTATKKADTPTKPPKFALEGSKWTIENQVGNRNIVISDVEAKQTCYIYKCSNSTIQVKGKINAIVIDACTKTAVVFENLVSTCDVVNCTSVEVQITGKVPSISIDKTSGCQLYLGADALDTQIYTSKSSEMNILIPGKTADEDLVELPVPEQYCTVVKNGRLHTECSSHV